MSRRVAINLIAFVVLWIATFIRIGRYPQDAGADLIDHQRGVDDPDALWIFAFPVAHDVVLSRDDERMKNLVQLLALYVVCENDLPQALPI